jgi:hypothetical protein
MLISGTPSAHMTVPFVIGVVARIVAQIVARLRVLLRSIRAIVRHDPTSSVTYGCEPATIASMELL